MCKVINNLTFLATTDLVFELSDVSEQLLASPDREQRVHGLVSLHFVRENLH